MHDIDFTGRVVIVTGAGRGLGRSHADMLAKRGASVIVNDLAGADQAAQEINGSGGIAIASDHDISTPEGAQALIDLAVDSYGTIHALINNAGVGRYSSFESTSPEEYELVRRVGLDGTFFVTRCAWPLMAEAGYGRIVLTASGHGLLGGKGSAAYSTTKGGVFGMMRAAALDGEDVGIKVNSICPSAFTPMAESYVTKEWAEKMAVESPTSLVSPLVTLLASDYCPTTGVNYDVGSGRIGVVTPVTNIGFYDRQQTPESILANWSTVVGVEDQRAYPSSRASTEAIELSRQAADHRRRNQ